MSGRPHEVFNSLNLSSGRGEAAEVVAPIVEAPAKGGIHRKGDLSQLELERGASDWVSVTSESRLREIKKWATVSTSEWEREHGKEAEAEAEVPEEEHQEEGDLDPEELELEIERKRKSKARKWLRKYIKEHESKSSEMLKEGMVNLQRIYETVAYVSWYLDHGRLDFGDAKLLWVEGTAAELKRLAILPEESSVMVSLRALKACVILVHKMCEQGMASEVRPLEESIREISIYIFDTYNGIHLARPQRLALFEVLNNLACLDITRKFTLDAKDFIMMAASLVRDDDPDAETFLLNAASLIVCDRDGKEGEAESLMLRALEVAQARLGVQKMVLEERREGAEAVRLSLDRASAGIGEGASIPLPKKGKVFWVHIEDGQVENREHSREEIVTQSMVVDREIQEAQRRVDKAKVPVMRCCRKLGNLYRRAWRNRDKWGLARKYAAMLIEEAEGCRSVPVKDSLSNAGFLVDYYVTSTITMKSFADKKVAYEKARQVAMRSLLTASLSFGTRHCLKRSAELYEKAAATSMLARVSAEEATDLALSAVRIWTENESDPSYMAARALRIVSESLAYGGELEEAMAVALSASNMAIDALGEKHFKAKAIKKLYVEHKKVFLKLGQIGMGKAQSKDMARRMCISRMETKQWLEEWLGV